MIFSVCFQLLPPWVIHHAKSQASTFPLLQWASTLPGAKQDTGQRLYGTETQDIGHIGQVKLVSIYRVSEEQVVSLTEFHLNDDEKQVVAHKSRSRSSALVLSFYKEGNSAIVLFPRR